MSGDYSRHSYDPLRKYSATLLQQGRVALDSDWNEWVASVERRLRAGTVDTIGRATVPRETPDGFRIAISGTGANKAMTIGRGRMYAAGLLAENPGDNPQRFDLIEPHPGGRGSLGVLGEVLGSDTISYLEQPFLSAVTRPWLPAPEALPAGNGPHLVYLDVWQREVTHVEDPGLLEPALGGVDTSTRLQTVWQVRVLPDVGAAVDCQTPDAQIPGWVQRTRASAGRLTTEEIPVAQDDDPCLVPAAAGFRGLENHLYRVEIHRGGGTGVAAGDARFKWSRENASIATRISAINAADKIVVESVGRDEFLRIREGDWIEVTDDRRELAGLSGDMCLVKSVEDSTRAIVLTHPLSADLQPPGNNGDTLHNRNTRLRKWDQRGRILDRNGSELVNLDDPLQLNDPARRGTLPVPGAANGVQLESGILLRFDVEPNDGVLRVGDHWNFAARSASGRFERLVDAPPRGIHHHYCRLAVVTFPDTVVDCRHLWPPELGGETCACDVCVSADDHNSGRLTIQQALDSVRETGGTVCLEAGDYLLSEPLSIREATSVRLVGKGSRTILGFLGEATAALQIEFGVDIDVRNISFAFGSRGDLPAAGIMLANSSELVIEGCYFLELNKDRNRDVAIEMSGFVSNARIGNNVAFCGHGFVSRASQDEAEYLVLSDVTISENDIRCELRGIDFTGSVYFLGDVRLDANFVFRCREAAVRAVLQAHNDDLPTSRVRVTRNMIVTQGQGIVIGARLLEVQGNTILGIARAGEPGGSGVTLTVHELEVRPVGDARVIDNLVRGFLGDGVRVDAQCVNLTIARNTIGLVRGSGLFVGGDATVQSALIESNQMEGLCLNFDDPQRGCAGVMLANCAHLRFAGNVMREIANAAVRTPFLVGLMVTGSQSPHIENNDISGVGPADFIGSGIGIFVATFDKAVCNGNRVMRFGAAPQQNRSAWVGLVVMDGFFAGFKNFASAALNAGWPLYFGAASNAFRVSPKAVVAALLRGDTRAMIDDNTVEGFGGSVQLGLVRVADCCHFQDNHFDVGGEYFSPSVVEIQSVMAALVSNNRVIRAGDRACLGIRARQFTVTGNITTAVIQVNGAALPPPWSALNVF